MRGAWGRGLASVLLVALVAACTPGEDADESAPAPETDPPTEAETPEVEVAFDVGVTDEPCPDRPDSDRGCIYLGVLSDLTEGPFAAVATSVVNGTRAFWHAVNEAGGLADRFDVNVDEYARDTAYDVEQHAAAFEEIEPQVLALAHSFGTDTTLAVLDAMDAADLVAVPASWWSGWSDPDLDHGLVLEAGASYCQQAAVGLDWAEAEVGQATSVLTVVTDDAHGRDAAEGVTFWIEQHAAEDLGTVATVPNDEVVDQDEVVQRILDASPDRVVLAVGPRESAEIVERIAAQGFAGLVLGTVATWHPAVTERPEALEPIASLYRHVGPWAPLSGDSPAHDELRAALAQDDLPEDDGFTAGWVASYPLLAVLERAAEAGDLTRAGVRAAVEGTTVDHRGALASRTYGEPDGPEPVVVVSAPDPGEPVGLRVLEPGAEPEGVDADELGSVCREAAAQDPAVPAADADASADADAGSDADADAGSDADADGAGEADEGP